MAMTLDELVSSLKSDFGAQLRTVVLYGSAVAGEHIPNRSNYNVLVLVDALPLDRLLASAAGTRAWTAAGNPPPLLLTVAEWRASSDVFPMEYADILERNRVLYGEPPFDGLSVAPADLRLQVEHQAMGKLLQLRQGALAAGGDAMRQIALLAASLSTIMVVFRAIVRLHGDSPPTDYEALSRLVAERAGFDPGPFVGVVRHVRGAEPIPPESATIALAGYLEGMERVVAHVDELPAGGHA
jgi:hypothetical protein